MLTVLGDEVLQGLCCWVVDMEEVCSKVDGIFDNVREVLDLAKAVVVVGRAFFSN